MDKTKTTAKPKGQPVAAYLRISDADQSHDSQRAEVVRWLDSQGIDPERVAWYVDTASGRKASRPEYDRLQADIAAGLRSTVVVFKLDRIARDMMDGMAVLSAWCKAGVRVRVGDSAHRRERHRRQDRGGRPVGRGGVGVGRPTGSPEGRDRVSEGEGRVQGPEGRDHEGEAGAGSGATRQGVGHPRDRDLAGHLCPDGLPVSRRRRRVMTGRSWVGFMADAKA